MGRITSPEGGLRPPSGPPPQDKVAPAEPALRAAGRLRRGRFSDSRVAVLAAQARLGSEPADDYDQRLRELLDRVKEDETARQEYVDLLEVMGPEDPRTAGYRRQLTSRLF